MALDIPLRYEPIIEQIAADQHISKDEALDRILDAGLERLASRAVPPRVSYASLFGAAKDGYGSREAIDRAISDMRNEW